MTPPTVNYKGEPRELALTNGAFMRFKRLGGDFSKLDADPIDQAITLVCAMLDLPGDPITHADDFPPIPQWSDALMQAVKGYMGEDDVPGEPDGGEPSQTPASATD